MEHIIECRALAHQYGEKKIFENFSFSVGRGRIVGLLGKNGVGKSTTINILMGFLAASSGQCLVFGEDSNQLSPETKSKIGLLHEGHIQYDFMTIRQIERYYANFFPNTWKRDIYYNLVDKLNVPYSQTIRKLSCGQRSQVVLGLIFAQDAELLILDDYSMGLDVGYRSLFLEYLKNYVTQYNKTVLMTSHIMQDMEGVIDDIIILDSRQPILQMPLDTFMERFRMYQLKEGSHSQLSRDDTVVNYETFEGYTNLYSFCNQQDIEVYLNQKQIRYTELLSVSMDFEKAFMGYTGRY